MKNVKKILLFCFFAVLLSSCNKENSTEPIDDLGATNSANAGFTMLNNILSTTSLQNMTQQQYQEVRTQFESAYKANPNNPNANIGMGIMELMSVGYDNTLLNSLATTSVMPKIQLLNNQFGLIAEVPKTLTKFNVAMLKGSSASTIAKFQQSLESIVIPKIDKAIEHFTKAISNDTVKVVIKSNKDIYEIDKGEIYIARASAYAAKTAIEALVLYDYDLLDSQNTYSWASVQDRERQNYAVKSNDTLHIYDVRYRCKTDSAMAAALKYNLTNSSRTNFLKYRSGKSGLTIKQSLINMISDIESAYNFIKAETDDQTTDVIKQSMLTDFDSALSGDPVNINGHTYTTFNSLIAYLKGILNGDLINTTSNGVQFSIKLSALFDGGLSDMRTKLPSYQWIAENKWVKKVTEYNYSYSNSNVGGTYSYYNYSTGTTVVYTNIKYINSIAILYVMGSPVNFTDDKGNVIDPETTLPYFPDYTMGGLLPNMTRDKLKTILQ